MQGYIQRQALKRVLYQLNRYPVVALLGPRQSGKSTLAAQVVRHIAKTRYFDLQDPGTLLRFEDPVSVFESYQDHLLILDEIQRLPGLFSVMRSLIDRNRVNGRVLILGSASRDLIRQSAETLAGRICYIEITPFHRKEVHSLYDFDTHLTRGGFPLSLLSGTTSDSFDWRKNYIQTFLERDIPLLGGGALPPLQMNRLWRMLAHHHGQVLNLSGLSGALGVSVPTVKKYILFLEQTFVIRLLEPLRANLKSRLIKSPKVYIRDTGLLHNLLELETLEDIKNHPSYGYSYEGFVMENIITHFPKWNPSFLRTSGGAEVDLVLNRGQKKLFFEMKASSAPKVSKGFFQLVEALKPLKTYVIAPVKESFKVKNLLYISLDEWLSEEALKPDV